MYFLFVVVVVVVVAVAVARGPSINQGQSTDWSGTTHVMSTSRSLGSGCIVCCEHWALAVPKVSFGVQRTCQCVRYWAGGVNTDDLLHAPWYWVLGHDLSCDFLKNTDRHTDGAHRRST